VALYEGLARIEGDPARADAFRAIAADERRHAAIWEERLRAVGGEPPTWRGPRLRIRLILGVARVLGTSSVADMVRALEGDDEASYGRMPDAQLAAIALDERRHAEVWRRMSMGDPAATTVATTAVTAPEAASGEAAAAAAVPVAESWHRSAHSGTLRAAIFGINDGLVSNLALVMGVAGASVDQRFVILAGTAGLLAGAFSMAAGEYVSMQSQRELFERQIAVEREEIAIMPESERQELVAIYRSKGLSAEQAGVVADQLMADPEQVLDVMVREELGLDPQQLGSSWGAASSSFASFFVGALIPLLPWLVASGSTAVIASFAAALVALFLVGAGVSLFTGRGVLFTGLRQVVIGGGAAVVTWLAGGFLGVQVS